MVPWRELACSQGELLVSQEFSSPGWVGPALSPGNAENPAGDASEEGVQKVAMSPHWAPNGAGPNFHLH